MNYYFCLCGAVFLSWLSVFLSCFLFVILCGFAVDGGNNQSGPSWAGTDGAEPANECAADKAKYGGPCPAQPCPALTWRGLAW